MATTKSKVALVTGGSRGLGRNMAISLAKKGIDVVLTYNSNKASADEVVAEIQSLGQKAMAFQLDSSNAKIFTEEAGWINGQRIEVAGGIFL